jgi:hypothetical protein
MIPFFELASIDGGDDIYLKQVVVAALPSLKQKLSLLE